MSPDTGLHVESLRLAHGVRGRDLAHAIGMPPRLYFRKVSGFTDTFTGDELAMIVRVLRGRAPVGVSTSGASRVERARAPRLELDLRARDDRVAV